MPTPSRGTHPNSQKSRFQAGNPGGVITAATRARRAYRAAFDSLLGSNAPAASVLVANPKDTPAQQLARDTLRDALTGEASCKTHARRQIMDLYASRPPQGVYVSDDEGNPAPEPPDLAAIVARLAAAGVILPPGLTPRIDA